MSSQASGVTRPRRKAEYEIRFATLQAETGWQDPLGTQ
jgi:hypothetical protein